MYVAADVFFKSKHVTLEKEIIINCLNSEVEVRIITVYLTWVITSVLKGRTRNESSISDKTYWYFFPLLVYTTHAFVMNNYFR